MESSQYFDINSRFTPSWHQQTDFKNEKGYWFIFYKDKLLTVDNGRQKVSICPSVPIQLVPAISYWRVFGHLDDLPCFVVLIDSDHEELPSTYRFNNLRFLADRIEQLFFNLAGRGLQILKHISDTKFCSRCGAEMEERENDLSRTCPACGFTCFPRVSPAVIMAVEKEDNILLGRARHFPNGMYSTLAGFVEAGETLEETVIREVREETAITVGDVRYFRSQPWPFPHSLMVGFTASYISGNIEVDTNELEDARWFSASNMPKIPSKSTIARQLIDDFLRRNAV